MIEGSGSGRAKNMWIRWIRNTDFSNCKFLIFGHRIRQMWTIGHAYAYPREAMTMSIMGSYLGHRAPFPWPPPSPLPSLRPLHPPSCSLYPPGQPLQPEQEITESS
jgi:hypothetical protein